MVQRADSRRMALCDDHAHDLRNRLVTSFAMDNSSFRDAVHLARGGQAALADWLSNIQSPAADTVSMISES